MTITLPNELCEELERKARIAGFASVEQYVADLVHGDEVSVAVPEPRAGSRHAVSTREELEAKLLEGTSTAGDVIAGPDFWERRQKAAEDRVNAGQPQ